jgi:hypothetical protein
MEQIERRRLPLAELGAKLSEKLLTKHERAPEERNQLYLHEPFGLQIGETLKPNCLDPSRRERARRYARHGHEAGIYFVLPKGDYR